VQCKDIPEEPILEFVAQCSPWAVLFDNHPRSVRWAMPAGTPGNLARAKMRQMVSKGLLDGCACGCRGDFRIPHMALIEGEVKP